MQNQVANTQSDTDNLDDEKSYVQMVKDSGDFDDITIIEVLFTMAQNAISEACCLMKQIASERGNG